MFYESNTKSVFVDFLVIYFMFLYTYYTNMKFINQKLNKKMILVAIQILFLTLICIILDNILGYLYSVMIRVLLLSYLFNKTSSINLSKSVVITVLSTSINYILYIFSMLLSFVFFNFTGIQNEYINIIIMLTFYTAIVLLILRVKKLKNGISFLYKKIENDFLVMVILNISVIILFSIIILANYNVISSNTFGIGFVIIAITLFITIQESLQLYYKQRMLVKDLEETKLELENKKKEVEALEKENLEFSKVSHSIAHKQKSLEHKLNELSTKSEIADELDIKDRIENLDKDLREKTVIVLDKTGIDEIDDMLIFMQSECVKNKIDFQLQLSGNIYTMINHYIDKDELEILLADHIKNAIIAIGYGDNINKSILVRLGKLDGSYGLYVYDSGIEFEIETLLNLGKKPSTTHKDSGGTGMGFMNTFDTLRKHNASFIIEEYGKPVKDNFTKALKFKFDGKNEFKICSYREEEIKNKDKENSLIVEKLSL